MDSEKLLEALQNLHFDLRNQISQTYNRSLSFEDELFDRWERASFLGFGKGTSIYSNSLVIGDVKVGKETWIGPNTVLDGSGGLTIGDNCSISAGVQLYTHDTVEKRVLNKKSESEIRPTNIGSNNYIGPLSIIRSGVTLGNNVLIGAHSYVNRDLPDFTVAVGVPCMAIGKIEMDDNQELAITYTRKNNSQEALLKEIDNLKNRLSAIEKSMEGRNK